MKNFWKKLMHFIWKHLSFIAIMIAMGFSMIFLSQINENFMSINTWPGFWHVVLLGTWGPAFATMWLSGYIDGKREGYTQGQKKGLQQAEAIVIKEYLEGVGTDETEKESEFNRNLKNLSPVSDILDKEGEKNDRSSKKNGKHQEIL